MALKMKYNLRFSKDLKWEWPLHIQEFHRPRTKSRQSPDTSPTSQISQDLIKITVLRKEEHPLSCTINCLSSPVPTHQLPCSDQTHCLLSPAQAHQPSCPAPSPNPSPVQLFTYQLPSLTEGEGNRRLVCLGPPQSHHKLTHKKVQEIMSCLGKSQAHYNQR